ncbi:MAG: TolC family protein [Polyangiaceae bacterium]|nr:TolC family protein [Polyangiaceae bacterium]
MSICARALTLVSLLPLGCATSLETSARRDLDRPPPSAAPAGRPPPPPASPTDGSLAGYLSYALATNPELEAARQEWRAAGYRISGARRLPDPTFSYMYYIQTMEGQHRRHKLTVTQEFPWPGRLSSRADAASLTAESKARQSDAAALRVVREVSEAYWRVWLLKRTRAVKRDQRELVQQFTRVVRVRLEIGQATLAELGQMDLAVSRLTDELSGLDEQEHALTAELQRALGAPRTMTLPIADEPPPHVLPAEPLSALEAAALSHPRVEALAAMSESQLHLSRSATAEGYPGFMVGAEYMPGDPLSGDDPLAVMLSIKLPLWRSTYSDAASSARAQSAAYRAQRDAAKSVARAALDKALSDVRDAARKSKLYRDTLLPQAETVYESTLGAYQADRAGLQAVILVQRELLELQLELCRSQAELGVAWARLEEIVGRPVGAKAAP